MIDGYVHDERPRTELRRLVVAEIHQIAAGRAGADMRVQPGSQYGCFSTLRRSRAVLPRCHLRIRLWVGMTNWHDRVTGCVLRGTPHHRRRFDVCAVAPSRCVDGRADAWTGRSAAAVLRTSRRFSTGLKYALNCKAPIAQLAEAADLKSSELGVCCVGKWR